MALSSPISTITTTLHCGNPAPQDNPYLQVAIPVVVEVIPETTPTVQQVKVVESVVYEGMKAVLQGLYNCSDMFLPLKTAAGGILTIINFVEVCVLMYNNTGSLYIIYPCTSDCLGKWEGTQRPYSKAGSYPFNCQKVSKTQWLACIKSPN